MRLFASLMSAVVFATLGVDTLGAEPTGAVELHKQLKASDDHTLGLLANRWWSLIQRQPWTDTTGKFSVDAKFVSQDAEKKTVTLLASRGKGGDRVEKEITVPLGKLSKQSQARAMRIARLMPKLEEKLAEVEAEKKEEGSDTRSEPQLAGAMREYAASEGEFGEEGFESGERNSGPPIPPRRRTSRKELPPEEEFPAMNPYGRLEKSESEPQDAKPDYVVNVEYVPAEFPEGKREGWEEFYEPLGDESHLEFRTIPGKPIAGKTLKLLVIPSNVYGRPKPKTYVRIGDPTADPGSVYKSPDDGPAWAEMELVGGRIQNLKTEKMVPLGETEENPRMEQPGESYYLIGLKLPAGKAVLDIKFVMDSEYIDDIALRLMELDVAPSEVGSD